MFGRALRGLILLTAQHRECKNVIVHTEHQVVMHSLDAFFNVLFVGVCCL